jgi:uncharacterized C2H2 Zn-finger protein
MKVVLADLSQMEVIIEANPQEVTDDDCCIEEDEPKADKPKKPEFLDCPHCGFRTKNRGSLKRHVDTIHLHPRQFECGECKYR